MNKYYLDKEGVKVLWDKTKEKIAESCAEVTTKVDAVEAKVDEIQSLTDDEINTILVDNIVFTINGTRYIADEGMNWREWVDSEYNTTGFYEFEGGYIYDNLGNTVKYLADNSNVRVSYSDDILEGYAYALSN